MQFAVYGCWDHGSAVPQGTEDRVAHAIERVDARPCVWTDPRDRRLLRIGLDVEATDVDEAVEAGRAELSDAARATGLEGRLVEVVAMTEDAQSVWSA